MIQRTNSNIILQIMCLALLTSCGGGSSDKGEDNPTVNSPLPEPDPLSSYNGSTDPALLKSTNTPKFSSMLLGTSIETPYLNRQSQSSTSILNNQQLLISTFLEKTSLATNSANIQRRNVSETEACEINGNVTISGEVDESTETGYLIYTFNACEEDSGIAINGVAFQNVHSNTDTLESQTLGYDDMLVTQSGESFTLSGTIFQSQAYSADGTSETLTQVSNLSSTHQPSGLSTHLKDYTLTNHRSHTNYSESISGQAFISDEGYVSVSTTDDYEWFSITNAIPTRGFMYLSGASHSKARIMTAEDQEIIDYERYRLDLDSDGNNIYEQTSIQNSSSDTYVELDENQSPTAVISANKSDWDEYDYYENDTEYSLQETVYLHSDKSFDADDTILDVVWTIEEKPSGSASVITTPTGLESSFATFTPDLHGEYKISLKVSDPYGSQQTSLDFIDILVPTYSPYIFVAGSSYSGNLIGQPYEVSINAEDRDTFSDVKNSLIVSYEWIQRPEGSTSEFSLTYSNYSDGEPMYEISGYLSEEYSILPDKAGTYKVKFSVTDASGLVASDTVEFVARTGNLTLDDATCYGDCDWASGTAKNYSNLSLEMTSYDFFSCSWLVSSQNADTTGVTEYWESSGDYINFTPGIPGNYNIELECTNAYGTKSSITYVLDVS